MRRRCRAAAPLLALAASTLFAGTAAASAPADVEFAAPDGLMLHATYWAADGPGPAVLLLHQCNKDRASWSPLAGALADAGLHVLAFDFRGFGASRGPLVGEFQDDRDRLWQDFPMDVDRALAFVRTLPDVDGERLGVMGASCGGSQALLAALRDPAIRAIGFLSSSLPWLADAELAQFEANRSLPILAVAADADQGALQRAKRLFEGSKHARSELILYKGELHGVPLFEHDPGLVGSIVAWFRSAL
jgi:alpha-beta hydrolase superfamily lysophospholipase